MMACHKKLTLCTADRSSLRNIIFFCQHSSLTSRFHFLTAGACFTKQHGRLSHTDISKRGSYARVTPPLQSVTHRGRLVGQSLSASDPLWGTNRGIKEEDSVSVYGTPTVCLQAVPLTLLQSCNHTHTRTPILCCWRVQCEMGERRSSVTVELQLEEPFTLG